MKKIIPVLVSSAFVLASGSALATPLITTFEGFTTGASVNGQGGWGVSGTYDEEVVVDGTGNTVWRVSNAITSYNFHNQPFAPRPGGIPTDTTTDPVNGNPGSFAGESSTGAGFDRFTTGFDFRSATGQTQDGLSITFSADSGQGGRHGFIDIEDNGVDGLNIVTFDVDSGGNFVGPLTIATGLSYDVFHSFSMEILFEDGADNDVVNYFVDGSLVHTGQSWEQFYTNAQAALHPLGVPVQTGLFRISGAEVPGVDGGGLFIDNFSQEVSSSQPVPEPSALALFGLSLIGLTMLRRRKV